MTVSAIPSHLTRESLALSLIAKGLSYSEAAAEMGVTRCALAGLVHRARARGTSCLPTSEVR